MSERYETKPRTYWIVHELDGSYKLLQFDHEDEYGNWHYKIIAETRDAFIALQWQKTDFEQETNDAHL